MSERETAELVPTATENGSGPPEDKGALTVSENKSEEEVKVSDEKKDVEEKKDGEEEKDGEEKKDVDEMKGSEKEMDGEVDGEEKKDSQEKKDVEEKKDSEEMKDGEDNGVRTEEEEAGKEEEKTEDADMVEAEDVKMAKAGDVKDEEELVKEEGLKLEEERDSGVIEKKGDDDEEEATNEEGLKLEEERDSAVIEKKVDENEGTEMSARKRKRGQKVAGKGEAKAKKEGGAKVKELTSTPVASSIERPVRERKTVERLVEVIEKEPNKGFLIKKGPGTPLKDIPNVSYKIGRKKPADLKLLHHILFGRQGKTVDFKNHILQFSGFSWPENDEKQKAKVKEKVDKCVKDTLLEICDLFDIPVLKSTSRKEDLVVKLLDFMVSPHVTTDVILAEEEQQSTKSRKRKSVTKGSASKSARGTPVKRSTKKRMKTEGIPNIKGRSAQETEDEEDDDDEDNENGVPDDDEALGHSDSDAKEGESEEAGDEDEDDDEDLKKGKHDVKKSPKQQRSARKETVMVGTSPKKAALPITAKSPSKSSTKRQVEESEDVGHPKVFSRKKKNVDAPKKKSSPKPDKKVKASGKKVATGRGKSEEAKQPGPSKEELRKTICEILKGVDFNTATFTDILKQLAGHYKLDLTSRKATIKLLIQDELTKLADEAEENEDDEEDEDTEKGENPKPASKELEA